MTLSQYDVLVVGAGCAGLTAAIGLSRAGFAVAVVEAAPYPGSANGSGGVYFTENLAHPDILGPAGVEALAWERRLVERGLFATDGHGLFGATYRDPDAFRNCYTVLRPVFDHHLAEIARGLGVVLLTGTTVESLVRDRGRVIGVATQRGPLYADLVFLAEGDAAHLVAREGYERSTDPRDAPRFLLGIQQVLELPTGAVEERFGLGPDEGAAYTILLRNGTLGGRSVHLNMRGLISTNRRSLSVGLLVPADNLRRHFGGDPNQLLAWFEGLPALRPWYRAGRRGTCFAGLIRGGGAKDVPYLTDEGLAVGGAATAVGVDFPVLNFTGPATATGLLLARAARQIRAEGTGFTREALERHYLGPLGQSRYGRDVEFLRRWPRYVRTTRVLFDRTLDLVLGSAYTWTRRRPLRVKVFHWLRLLHHLAGPPPWGEMRRDLLRRGWALHVREATGRPALGRLLLDGTLNAFRDLLRRPRAHVPPAGSLRLHYHTAGGGPDGQVPGFLHRWFGRFRPVLAAAAREVYRNDDVPLAVKFSEVTRMLVRQVNLLDLLAAAGAGLATAVSGLVAAGWRELRGRLGRRVVPTSPGRLYADYAAAARQTADLTAPDIRSPGQPQAGAPRDLGEPGASAPGSSANRGLTPAARLGDLVQSPPRSLPIHLLWPLSLPQKNAVTGEGLWHVCPAGVFACQTDPLGQVTVQVHAEKCIGCEVCWRTSRLVDWGRDGGHGLVYPVATAAVARLTCAMDAAGLARPLPARVIDPWQPAVRALAVVVEGERGRLDKREDRGERGRIVLLLDRLERKLEEFDAALARGPSAVDRARGEYLEMLAQYADRLAARVAEELAGSRWSESWSPGTAAVGRAMLGLAVALKAKTEERARRTWDGRFAWAAADGRQICGHHLVGLRRMLAVLPEDGTAGRMEGGSWLQAERDAAAVAGVMEEWKARFDTAWHGWGSEEAFPLTPDPSPPQRGRGEKSAPAPRQTAEQDDVLRELLARVPRGAGVDVLRSPLRKALLAELGRRDPSAAYRVACHLWARDLAGLCPEAPDLTAEAERWARGDEWACVAPLNGVRAADGSWGGEAAFVPAGGAAALLLLVEGRPVVVPAGAPEVRIEPLEVPGLRGAGLARVRVEGLRRTNVPGVDLRPAWGVLSSADLIAIASGLADELCRRAVAQATTGVQFPGLFHDEEGRDSIAKFGAVKRRVAEVAAHCYLLETIGHTLSPTALDEEAFLRAGLLRALAAEVLGVGPGGVAFNVGQLFGRAGLADDPSLASLLDDASAWRFLGVPGDAIYARYGRRLTAGVAEVNGAFEEVLQRQALRAEVEAVRRLEARGQALARDRETLPASPDFAAGEAEMAEGLARQSAYLLAGKALLLRTHARLEEGLDCAVEAPLLRVWLDGADVSLDEFAGRVQRRLDSSRRYEDRPLVEPGTGPPVSSWAEYRAAAASYESGDFLVRPVDLLQPRLVPEAAGGAGPAWPPAADERARRLLAAVDALRERTGHARALAGGGGVAEEAVLAALAWRVRRMEEDLFVAEALAFDVAGRGLHPGTKSLRMEWLIARVLLAELRHRVGESFAEIGCLAGLGGGPGGDLRSCIEVGLYVDERRNARRRFFLLKQLVTEVAPRWARDGGEGPRHLGREVLELEALKVQFRQRLEAARELFGQDLWRNPNLQANCLALSEMAAWLLAADSTLGRAAWLYRREGDEGEEPGPDRELSLRALARCSTEVRDRLHRFDEDLTQLRRGYYAPHVRAASLLFDRATGRPRVPAAPPEEVRCTALPRSVLVVVAPRPVVRLQPDGGNRREPYWGLGPADEAALEAALRLRDAAPGQVRVAVAAVGPRRVGPLLRELLGRGFERAWLVVEEAGDRAALPRAVRAEGPFDLILGGSLGRHVAAAAGVPYAGAAGRALRPFTVAGYLEGLGRDVEVIPGENEGGRYQPATT